MTYTFEDLCPDLVEQSLRYEESIRADMALERIKTIARFENQKISNLAIRQIEEVYQTATGSVLGVLGVIRGGLV